VPAASKSTVDPREEAQRPAHDPAASRCQNQRAAFASGETDTRAAAATVEREHAGSSVVRRHGDERDQQAADPERAHERDQG